MYVDSKKVWIIICVFFLLFIFYHVARAEDTEDWAFYESEAKAREIYNKKIIQIPCASIDDLLRKNDINGLYIAIRDAALFGDKTCDRYIKKKIRKLKFSTTTPSITSLACTHHKNAEVSLNLPSLLHQS